MMTSLADKTKWITILLAGALIFSNTSCKKENNEIGSDIIGNRSGFNVQVTDTFDVIAYTSLADSVDTRFLSYYMLGQTNDPVIGKTTANLVTQFLYPVSGFSFTNFTIDSVVLQLRYAGPTAVYGNNTTQTIKVYEIAEDLPTSSSEYFYSNRTYQTTGNELGSYTGTFNTTDSAIVFLGATRLSYAPQMRIKITDPAFINKLINTPTDSFANAASFKSVFKGLMISAEQTGMNEGDGAICYLNMRTDNNQSALVVYGRENTNNTVQKYDFPIAGTSEVKANQYKHSLKGEIHPPVGGNHKNVCAVSGAAGLKTRILIPSLNQLGLNQAIAVNSAKLVVKTLTTDTSVYRLPERLNLWDSYENGTRKMIADFTESIAYYGGYYNSSNNAYTFAINRYVQGILNAQYQLKTNINFGLNLYVPEDFPIAANRAVLNTNRSVAGEENIKLILTYTVIK